MRVLHVIEGLAPALGGLSRSAANLSELIAHSGAEVEIITTLGENNDRLFQPTGVKVQALPRRFFHAWGYAPRLSHAIKNAVSKTDLIHLHGLWLFPHFVASRAAWRAQKPYVVSPQGMMDTWALAQGKFKKRLYGELIEWRTLQRAAAIHAVSESEARDIRRLGFSSDIFTIPNGINQAEFARLPSRTVFRNKYPALADKTVFLFLGRIHPKKGLDSLVRSFCEVTRARPKTFLVIAGPDEIGYRKHLEACLNAEGFFDRCLFTGMLQPEERLAVLAAADIFILPSFSEGFPIAAIEALAAGLPVILTEACNIPGIEQEGVGIIVSREIGSLSEAMLRLTDDISLRKQLGLSGRRLALAKYTWDRVAVQMSQVYEKVVLGQNSEYARKEQFA